MFSCLHSLAIRAALVSVSISVSYSLSWRLIILNNTHSGLKLSNICILIRGLHIFVCFFAI